MARSKEQDIDSLRPLVCGIEAAVEVSGHTEYVVRLSVPHTEASNWIIHKRYNDFAALHSSLAVFGSIPVECPPKRTFGNKEREFVAERQMGLQIYLQGVLENLYLLSSKVVKEFLHVGPRITDISGSAFQFMSMVFRTDNRFEIAEPLPGIGWRVNKEFAMVKCSSEPKIKLIGCWTFYGPDRILLSSEISSLLQSFSTIKHPLFFPLNFADARETGCVTVRSLQPQGSLWDVIKNNKMSQPFLQKCAKNKVGKGLSIEDIQRFGRQILEALKFLHDSTIPYGNLSSRNVFIDKEGAHVSDIESGVCGLRSFYWPFILQLRKINTFEAIDVYCFGLLLYEMVFGQPCETPTSDTISSECPTLIRVVLESILTPEACGSRGGMPTVSQLLTQPLFNNVVLNYEPVSMKISRKIKDSLASAKEKMEARIVNEQKLYHNYVKDKKANSLQTSEDERKKRRLQALKSQISSDVGVEATRTPTPTDRDSGVSKPAVSSNLEEMTGMPPKASVSTTRPPGPPPPPIPAARVTNGSVPTTSDGNERNALLASIRGFKKDVLAPAETQDKSAPFLA